MTSSTDLARTVVAALMQAGVTDVVIAPGSRNAPLSFAAFAAAEAGALRLHTRIDERTAAFLALGLSKVSRRPAAVVCTSGTAVANFHPAALEAAHAGVALVLVTADRPASLRGTSANQTTDQVRMIPGLDFLDVAGTDQRAEVDGLLAGRELPLHLNVQLADPLVPPDAWQVPAVEPVDNRRPRHHEVEIPHGPRTVVVAGDDAGPAARVLAQRGQWPLLAEPTSGSRTGTHALRTYRLLLDGELGEQVERVVVAGHPTLSRPVSRLLARDDVEVWDIEDRGLWRERPFAVARAVARATTAESTDTSWFDAWVAADRSVARQLDDLLRAEADLTPYDVAGVVSRAVPPGGLLWVGASSPIRDLDLMAARYDVGDRRKVVANRGLAGIDGTVSSAIGATLGRPRSSRALALMGDVTFLHDATGMILGPGQPRPDLTIVVVNDNGGSIFTMLEQGAPEFADRYDALFGTPHDVDIASLCAATRTPHLRVTSLPELEQALASPNGGIEVVEAVVRRDNRRDLDRRIRALRG
ncbi:2-succinyl-5-enolpyruvyl-6-hydroxy-3-cyclohexene-1-carboxylic-acid synthase [Nocardioides sp.]|uniref:2-succinyl-5-enolpyruvyl-6-hydroxy-3- cyclohexene-1-carboxylic-acid synthase n=1 Tax=Nocardioides sp. TaxID=35761 RepID=UPI002CE58931|nr:2-succinyl-5-enolpyruvyl-6-hydroxy-3-cyclohexene-1-carboxylic-acid synthase [Nocardioides sp.]HXH79721.1 2-succinyl-5-enolpyruvyl-6-hydroxy-3-cyclohexene-1-carboxylic-acid synthase [Nocardioides sp.]